MNNKLIAFLVVVGVANGTGQAARGAIAITSGTLHASASAEGPSGTVYDNPPDETFVPPATSQSASASTGYSLAQVAHTLTKGAVDVTIDAFGHENPYMVIRPFYYGYASAFGYATILEDRTENVSALISYSPYYCEGEVWLTDSTNTKRFDVRSNFRADGSATVTLSPGEYTLHWDAIVNVAAGTGGSSAWNFRLAPIPEPSTLGAVIFAGTLLGLERRKVKSRISKP